MQKIILLGPHGLGKTTYMEKVAKESNLKAFVEIGRDLINLYNKAGLDLNDGATLWQFQDHFNRVKWQQFGVFMHSKEDAIIDRCPLDVYLYSAFFFKKENKQAEIYESSLYYFINRLGGFIKNQKEEVDVKFIFFLLNEKNKNWVYSDFLRTEEERSKKFNEEDRLIINELYIKLSDFLKKQGLKTEVFSYEEK